MGPRRLQPQRGQPAAGRAGSPLAPTLSRKREREQGPQGGCRRPVRRQRMSGDEPESPRSELILFRAEDAKTRIQVRLEGDSVWLTQRQMADLFDVSVPTVNEHLGTAYGEGEIEPERTIRKFRIVQTEGTRQVRRLVDHYHLDAILAVGYRVRSERGTQFRQWATAR